MADSKKYNGSTWEHSLRKLATATDTFTTLPADIYADGNTATVGLKGNTVQTGTPTPQNPIMPQGTGERTGNLLNPSDILYNTEFNTGSNPPAFVYSDTLNCSNYIPVTAGTYLRILNNVAVGNWFYEFDANKNYLRTKAPGAGAPMEISVDASYIAFNISNTTDINNYMFARTSTPIPYEPYGYKIPISSASTTTPVYFSEVQTTRRIKKLVLTGEENITSGHLDVGLFNIPIDDYIREPIISLICTHYIAQSNVVEWSRVSNKNTCFYVGSTVEFRQLYIRDSSYSTIADFKAYLQQQYAAGTPVTVWYALATPTTGIVNEPIRKIGEYADEVSGITIPTIAGADSFDVLTTLKPSEASLNYTGWHDATVQEWDGSQWNE